MKWFVKKIALLFIIIFTLDNVLGYGLHYIVSSITVGGQGRDNYIANEACEDILVFGSSRAVHHYNTPLLEDSLCMTAYNCGEDGSGIILSYARLAMIKERHQPQIIIHDVMPEFDLFKNDNHKYIGWLKTHYEKECLRPVFDSVDKIEKYKMMCHLYRYNSNFLQNIAVFFTGKAYDGGVKGFRPLEGTIDKLKIKEASVLEVEPEYDELKLEYIKHFIELSEGAQLFFIVSPIWYGMDTSVVSPFREICNAYDIPFLDFSNDPRYVHNDNLFVDGIHLNKEGARAFTNDILNCINSIKAPEE